MWVRWSSNLPTYLPTYLTRHLGLLSSVRCFVQSWTTSAMSPGTTLSKATVSSTASQRMLTREESQPTSPAKRYVMFTYRLVLV